MDESIGRLHLGAAPTGGGELVGGLLAHGIQDPPEAAPEPLIATARPARFRLARYRLARLRRLTLHGAELGRGGLFLDPSLHGAVLGQGARIPLVGLGSVPGERKLTDLSCFHNEVSIYLDCTESPCSVKVVRHDEGHAPVFPVPPLQGGEARSPRDSLGNSGATRPQPPPGVTRPIRITDSSPATPALPLDPPIPPPFCRFEMASGHDGVDGTDSHRHRGRYTIESQS